MDPFILAAAILMSITVVVHVVLGGAEVMVPLHELDASPLVRSVLDVVWHMVTVTLVGIAVALFWLTWNENAALFWTVSAMQIGFATLFIWYGVRQLRSLWPMPQWTVFLLVPALTIYGAL